MNCAFSCSRTLFVLSAGLWFLPLSVAYAVTKADGTTAFTQPPILVTATTPYTDTNIRGTTYYFTIELPATAGEPLKQVNFTQIQGTDNIRFDSQDSRAFEGTRDHRGAKLALKPAISNQQQQSFTVTFDSPVPPGKTVTIGLRPLQNPISDGVYLFKVTAFPNGQQSTGQHIGIGRLQFYNRGN